MQLHWTVSFSRDLVGHDQRHEADLALLPSPWTPFSDLDSKIARGIALGERNPITKLVMVDPWPTFLPAPVKTPIKHQPKITDMFSQSHLPTSSSGR